VQAWQRIFQQSRVNNAIYIGEGLAVQNWRWPRNTWFQKRLGYIRKVSVRGERIPYDGRMFRRIDYSTRYRRAYTAGSLNG
jgi:hypothetical protein